MKYRLFIFLLCLHLIAVGQISPQRLTCEYVNNPTVVDVLQPRLAWVNSASVEDRGQIQTAYQIRAASEKTKLESPDLWNSGKVLSSKSNRIEYNGIALQSGQDVWWQVKVWDKNGKPSEWSQVATWSMGLLNANDWQADWIGAPWQDEEALPEPPWPDAPVEKWPPPAPLIRKSFVISKGVEKAKAYVTGLGYFEFYVNGNKTSKDVLVPNQTNYGKRDNLLDTNIPLPDEFTEYKVMYMAYDITSFLKEGENVFGAILGNGFYNAAKYWTGSYGSPRFLGQIEITYTDGTKDIIASDKSWKVSKGPILMDMVYYGEKYDARLEQPGWNKAGFDDTSWENAITREQPFGKLVAHTPYADRVMESITPVSIELLDNGIYNVDFGVEISGWVRLKNVTGPKGHQVDIKFLSNLYSGENTYIFKGDSLENYAPRFNWFVFSGVEISNWPGELKKEHLVAESVNTWIEETSEFETSNTLFNEIHKIWKRSQLDNMHGGLASDCPHRERAGYTGDGQVACVTVMHNFDARSFYDKWIQDIRGAQIKSTGYVPNGAPWEPGCGGGVAWGAAICVMPWEFYQHYGSKDILEDNYNAMKGYIGYMKTWLQDDGTMFSKRTGKDDNILKWFNLGEWSWPELKTIPDDMVHTFYYWRCVDITSKVAGILGFSEDEKFYDGLVLHSKKAFNKRYYQPGIGSYGPNGGNIFALVMGVPEDQYPLVLSALKKDIEEDDGHLDTGIFGTQFFFETLSDHGFHNLAFEAMNKKTFPGFGYWIEDGATTTREAWDNSGSHNHPMFGGGINWFYRKLAGLNLDITKPGYQHIIFKPMPAGDISFVKYSNLTPNGRAGIHWKLNDEIFSMEVEIPVGSTATVYVPVTTGNILEGFQLAKDSDGVEYIGLEDEYAVYNVGSGMYSFSTPGN